MNPLSLQGEFIKQRCVSLLGAVYFGVAEPGGKGRRNPSNLPSRPSKCERKGGKGGEGAEILPAPPLPAAGGESQRAVGGRHLTVFQERLLLFPKATCTDLSDEKCCRRHKGGCSCTERGSGGEELFALCSQTLWYLGRSLWYLGR